MKLPIGSGIVLLTATFASAAPTSLQNILKNTDRSGLYQYPTDLTRDIIPVPVHSHNDYWRDVPFYTALAAGCISIEADVWLYDDTLYVGHDQSSLTKKRTLSSLYIEPILEVLKKQNPKSQFVTERTKNGVYDTSPGQTLYLFIDVKTSGREAWPHIVKALKPLRDQGYLTTLKDNTTLTKGPVTVIGTGGTPLELVAPVANRDYFIDGPLADLKDKEEFTSLLSPIASTSFEDTVGDFNADTENPLNSTQLSAIREQIKTAKERGIGVRYWGTPGWPVRLRNELWRVLLKEGVTLLNADDLEATGKFF
ncbi:hypothetical protein FQN57_001977 [Myotisia sp. PD_48]|nr:hypothetical protein FQN57_001977 [Myotisia sp. PD_48]